MKKLLLYSEQEEYGKQPTDQALLGLLDSNNPKIGYIPASSDFKETHFNITKNYYSQNKIENFLYFDLDLEYQPKKINELLNCNAIHLSCGNTYTLLHSLKKRNLIPVIHDYVNKGGVLIGESAGSIIMAKTLGTTTLFKGDPDDDNTVGLTDFSALNLVDFEFFPHFNQNPEYFNLVKACSKTNNSLVYACNDGDGIVVNGDKTEFIGNIVKFEKGKLVI